MLHNPFGGDEEEELEEEPDADDLEVMSVLILHKSNALTSPSNSLIYLK